MRRQGFVVQAETESGCGRKNAEKEDSSQITEDLSALLWTSDYVL